MSASDHLGQQFEVTHEGAHLYGGEYSVARLGGEAVGYMRHSPVDSDLPIRATRVNYVHVDPEHRGKGAAESLYAAVHQQTGVPFLHAKEDLSPEGHATVRALAKKNPDRHWMLGFKSRHGIGSDNWIARKVR